MPIDRRVKKSIALALAVAAIAAATETGTQALGARPVNAITDNRGNPNAVPPILRPARPSELAAIRRGEAQERRASRYRVPPSARYSNAEMDAFASEGYGGS